MTTRIFWAMVLSFSASAAFAQDAPVKTLFVNVHVFDGVHEKRIENANVLIEDNLIAAVSSEPIEANGATIIDGGGCDTNVRGCARAGARDLSTLKGYLAESDYIRLSPSGGQSAIPKNSLV